MVYKHKSLFLVNLKAGKTKIMYPVDLSFGKGLLPALQTFSNFVLNLYKKQDSFFALSTEGINSVHKLFQFAWLSVFQRAMFWNTNTLAIKI